MTAKRSLNPLDRMFLATETRESMMHVGALLYFSPPSRGESLPPGDTADFQFRRQLREELRQQLAVFPPWNLKLRHPDLLSHPLQSWVEDSSLDIDYHVRRSALPWPGDERELGILVSRLHSHQLDFHRPPWEVHFIEGLEGGRFAVYFKVHHALVDGFTGMRILTKSLSSTPDDKQTPLFFSCPEPTRSAPTEGDAVDEPTPSLETLLHLVREQFDISKDLGRAIGNIVRASRAHDKFLVAPMQAPQSILNERIGRNRRFATQSYTIERLKAVAKQAKGTVNDVALALCASSLRRVLREQNALPDKALVAMIPVNVRPRDDPGGGNAVGAVLASLATDVDDPLERLSTIIQSTTRAKEQLQGLSKNAILQYGALLVAPVALSMIPGAVGRVSPSFNVVVSNVPGPDKPLYFRGWRLQANYPLSIPFNGHALNITLSGNAGSLGFGFTGCRDALPHLQRVAVYSGEALAELERLTIGKTDAHRG